MVVVLNDGELAMEHHPVYEVRKLAEASTNALRGFPIGDKESLLVAFPAVGAPNKLPHGERLARVNEDAVDMAHGQCEVRGLVLLQLHVHVAQAAAYEGVVAIDKDGQTLLRTLHGEMPR